MTTTTHASARPDPASVTRIDVRFPLDAPATLPAEPFIEIFGRWRMDADRVARDALIDLADYAHVPSGPRVLLIGHRFHLGLDWDADGPGVLYSHRGDLEGSLDARIGAVLAAATEQAEALLAEPEVPEAGRRLRPGTFAVTFNDRVRTPNADGVDAEVAPALKTVLDARLGEGAWRAAREPDPRRRLAYRVTPS